MLMLCAVRALRAEWPRTEGLRPALWLPILHAFDHHGAVTVVSISRDAEQPMLSRSRNRASMTVLVTTVFNFRHRS